MNTYDYDELINEAQKDGIYRYVVASVVEQNSQILILKRPQKEFMGGIYELPSGKIEENESLLDALSRELQEETGLKLKEIKKYLGYFDYQSKTGKVTRQFNFAITSDNVQKIILSEHDSYTWVGVNQLSEYSVTENVKLILENFLNGVNQ